MAKIQERQTIPLTPREEESSVLERELAERGIISRKFRDEYGIDPSRILEYKENQDGSKIFLCYEQLPDGTQQFYIIQASEKTKRLEEVAKRYMAR